LYRRICGPQSRSGHCGEEENFKVKKEIVNAKNLSKKEKKWEVSINLKRGNRRRRRSIRRRTINE
jgi:hypothetical protein